MPAAGWRKKNDQALAMQLVAITPGVSHCDGVSAICERWHDYSRRSHRSRTVSFASLHRQAQASVYSLEFVQPGSYYNFTL